MNIFRQEDIITYLATSFLLKQVLTHHLRHHSGTAKQKVILKILGTRKQLSIKIEQEYIIQYFSRDWYIDIMIIYQS